MTPTQKTLNLIDTLKEMGVIRFDVDFCRAIGITKAQLNLIKIGNNQFTALHLQKICVVYNVNANWIFGTQNKIFRAKKSEVLV